MEKVMTSPEWRQEFEKLLNAYARACYVSRDHKEMNAARAALLEHLDATPAAQPIEDMTAIYDAFKIGAKVRTPDVLLANAQNAIRRSDCLWAIEREFFTIETPPGPDDGDEPGEECLLNWGVERAEYVEQFRAALARVAAQPAMDALPSLDERIDELLPTQWGCVQGVPTWTREQIRAFARALLAQKQPEVHPTAPVPTSGAKTALRVGTIGHVGAVGGVGLAAAIMAMGLLEPKQARDPLSGAQDGSESAVSPSALELLQQALAFAEDVRECDRRNTLIAAIRAHLKQEK